MDIDGIVAFVTGSGSGLGQTTSRRLTSAGERVAVADMNQDATVEQIVCNPLLNGEAICIDSAVRLGTK
jgi:NAD(P)-dependent dehydrogenase (short-subunit alcohol dehydrogenase family)